MSCHCRCQRSDNNVFSVYDLLLKKNMPRGSHPRKVKDVLEFKDITLQYVQIF
jgi:hypothetical protein